MRKLNFYQCKSLSLISFCSESPHGERASTEDSVQDVTAEHHTSDDGMWSLLAAWLTGATCCGGGREDSAMQFKFKMKSKSEFKLE